MLRHDVGGGDPLVIGQVQPAKYRVLRIRGAVAAEVQDPLTAGRVQDQGTVGWFPGRGEPGHRPNHQASAGRVHFGRREGQGRQAARAGVLYRQQP